MQDAVGRLEQRLGFPFRDKGLLSLALVHPSYVNEHPDAVAGSNQRLEFLGDAVVDTVVAEEVYRRFPSAPEGQLTVLRAAVVRDESMGQMGRRLGLGELLLLGQGEEATGGRERISNLADAFEAVVGALFLDRGYEAAKGAVLKLLADEMTTLSEGKVLTDAKSELQELAQQQGKSAPTYRVVKESGPEHAKEFEVEVVLEGDVVGTGRGRRKAEAEREAAARAVAAFRSQARAVAERHG